MLDALTRQMIDSPAQIGLAAFKKRRLHRLIAVTALQFRRHRAHRIVGGFHGGTMPEHNVAFTFQISTFQTSTAGAGASGK